MSLIKQQAAAFNEVYNPASDEISVSNCHGIEEGAEDGTGCVNGGREEATYEQNDHNVINIHFDLGVVYASQTFAANLEGQVCVLKGDSLEVIDDSNSYWWLVKCIKTSEVGYVPAEIVEMPFERLARINKTLNITLSQVNEDDFNEKPNNNRLSSNFNKSRYVAFDKNLAQYIDDGYSNEEEEGGFLRKSTGSSISKVIINRFLPHRNKKFKRREIQLSDATDPSSPNEFNSSDVGPFKDLQLENVKSQSTAAVELDNAEPISVLRVYSGNTDLKATFKTVNFDKLITASELLRLALHRFKVPLSMESNYYLSILHMDSQVKRLKDDDVVYEVLESLRSKHLPGVSGFTRLSHYINKEGSVSKVLMNDDNIIRVIIKKEDAFGNDNLILARISLRHDDSTQNEEYIYKTLALNRKTIVSEAINMALKKFRIVPVKNFTSNLYLKKGAKEVLLSPEAELGSVISNQKGSCESVFVLDIKWAGDGSEPRPYNLFSPYTCVNSNSLAADINDILNLKPKFLEDSSQQSPNTNSDGKHHPYTDTVDSPQLNSNDSISSDDYQIRTSINGHSSANNIETPDSKNELQYNHNSLSTVSDSYSVNLRNKQSSTDSLPAPSLLNMDYEATLKTIKNIIDTRNYPNDDNPPPKGSDPPSACQPQPFATTPNFSNNDNYLILDHPNNTSNNPTNPPETSTAPNNIKCAYPFPPATDVPPSMHLSTSRDPSVPATQLPSVSPPKPNNKKSSFPFNIHHSSLPVNNNIDVYPKESINTPANLHLTPTRDESLHNNHLTNKLVSRHDTSAPNDHEDTSSDPDNSKYKGVKHHSTPLPSSSTSTELRPPLRKDSNIINLSDAFESLAVNRQEETPPQGVSSYPSITEKISKRSKSFDAMERYLEEIMNSSTLQSSADIIKTSEVPEVSGIETLQNLDNT